MVSVVVRCLILSHRLLRLPSSIFFWYRVIVALNYFLCFERIRIRFIIINLLMYLFLTALVTAGIKVANLDYVLAVKSQLGPII